MRETVNEIEKVMVSVIVNVGDGIFVEFGYICEDKIKELKANILNENPTATKKWN